MRRNVTGGGTRMPARPSRIVKGEAAVDLGAVFAAAASVPLIVCDVDNVLAYHAEAVCTALNARFGTNRTVASLMSYPFATLLHPDEAQWLARFSSQDQWALNLAPDKDAIRAVAAIGGNGNKVVISSDRPAVIATASKAWLGKHGVPDYSMRFDGPGSKRAALAGCSPNAPGILIDDDPRQWLTAARAGVQVWTPKRPWTPDGWQHYPNVRVFTSWDEPLRWLKAGR